MYRQETTYNYNTKLIILLIIIQKILYKYDYITIILPLLSIQITPIIFLEMRKRTYCVLADLWFFFLPAVQTEVDGDAEICFYKMLDMYRTDATLRVTTRTAGSGL